MEEGNSGALKDAHSGVFAVTESGESRIRGRTASCSGKTESEKR